MVAIKLSTRNRNNRFKQHNITVHVDNLLTHVKWRWDHIRKFELHCSCCCFDEYQ